MLVWCDPEFPEYVAVTSAWDKKEGVFVVKRLDDIPAINATAQQMAAGRLDRRRRLPKDDLPAPFAAPGEASIPQNLCKRRDHPPRAGWEAGIAQVRAGAKKAGKMKEKNARDAWPSSACSGRRNPDAIERTARGVEMMLKVQRSVQEEAAAKDPKTP